MVSEAPGQRLGSSANRPNNLDAPPDHDPMPRILEQLATIAERNRARPGWKEPTPEQPEDGRRAFDDAIRRIRAERQMLRDFTAFVEAKLAAGKTLGDIADPVRA